MPRPHTAPGSAGSSASWVAAAIGSSRQLAGSARAVKTCCLGRPVVFGTRTAPGSTSTGPTRNVGVRAFSAGATQSRDSDVRTRGSSPHVACADPPGAISTVSRTGWPGLARSGVSLSST